MCDSQRETIAFLGNPASYTPRPHSVARRETHGAIVFLAGEQAYKLKRAVHYPYMDYSTVALRKLMCERELVINRRTAPGLYLEVRPVVRDPNGTLQFSNANDAGKAIDWVVVMRRFAEADLLGEMLQQGGIAPALMRAVGDEIAAFHGRAERTQAFGGAQGIRAVIEENSAIMHRQGFNPEKVTRLVSLSREALARVGNLLDRRRHEGWVRHCHGDLHLNNICMIADRPVLFDAIEFNEAFSCIDVQYDLAFLLMDLMRHGLNACAIALLNRYLEQTGDYDGLAALPLFLSCRAAIRAHVTVSRAEQPSSCTPAEAARNEAVALLDFAINSLVRDPPGLVAIGGISGTGKSTLAYDLAATLAPPPGAIVLRSDVVRKRMAGMGDQVRLPESAYTPEMHDRVYTRLSETAKSVLAAGFSVIADAVYGRPGERTEIERTATEKGVPFSGLWLEAPARLLQDRIAERRGDASDATGKVLRAQIAQITRPSDWNIVDAAGTAGETFARTATTLHNRAHAS